MAEKSKEKSNDNNKKGEATPLDELLRGGSITTKNASETIHCLNIIGQIEGHYILGENQKATKYEHVIPLLVAIEESDEIDGLLVILNTMGGDVEAGLAISEMIASMTKPTVSLVLGGGHSIGVPLAVSSRRSFIVPSATMTIHPVRINGLVIGAPQTFNYFRDMQDRIIEFIIRHSKVDEKRLKRMMMKPDQMANDIGTVLEGIQAVDCGLIDEIGGLDTALAALREMIREGKTDK